MKKVINTKAAPAAIGPYSQAIKVGNLVYTSGQIPLHRERLALWMLIISFVLLQMCWWGINYLPSAQGSSVHTY